MSVAPQCAHRGGGLLPGAVVAVGAAAAFALTFGTTVQPMEEGIILFPAWRVAQGDSPYRDFIHIYTPAAFWLYGALFAWIGRPDWFAARLVVCAWKVGMAVLVYAVAARLASRAAAVLAALVFVAVWVMPVWVFETPYPSHFGVGLTLLGIQVLFSRRAPVWLRLLACGFALGLAALFKQTLGVLNTLAVALAWLSLQQRSLIPVGTGTPAPRFAAVFLAALPAGAAGVYLSYLWPHRDAASTWVLAVPALAGVAVLGWGWLRQGTAGWTWRDLAQLGALLGGAAAAPMGFVFWCATTGTLRAFIESTFTLPRMLSWFTPIPPPPAGLLVLALMIGGILAAAWTWRRGALWSAMAWTVVAAVAYAVRAFGPAGLRAAASLLELYRWAPIALTLALMPSALIGPSRAADEPAFVVCWFVAAAALLQWFPAADLPHVGMTLPLFLPLLAVAADRIAGSAATASGPRWRRWPAAAALALIIGLAVLPFLRGAWRVAAWPRRDRLAQPARASSTGQFGELVARVRSEPDPVLTLSGEELLYVLAERDSPIPREEHVIYLIAAGLLTPAAARAFIDEAVIVGRLRATRATVVESTVPAVAERVRAALPVVSAYLDAAYEPRGAVGSYRILRPASPDGAP